MGADGDWQEQRRRAIASHAAERDRRLAADTAKARDLVADFVRRAREGGLAASPLLARGHDGRGSYRTGRRGWYIRPDHTIAVGEDGGYYVLTVAPSLRARFTGVTVTPQDPRLIVGEGARDGESMPLETLLRQRLDAGDDWP
jgi:hypothetical protein